MKHLDLFSGIGGFALGLQWAGGFETVAFCEIDKFCKQVLAKNFPNKPIFGDVKDVSKDTLASRGISDIDLITAGFPCQPFSIAGKRKGLEDERFLWEEIYRVVQDTRPKYVLLENSPELLRASKGLVMGGILLDLSALGYAVEWSVIPALAVGAPHLRERVWVIAYPDQVSTGNAGQPGTLCHEIGNGSHQKQKRQVEQHGTASLCPDVPNANHKRLSRRSSQHSVSERGRFYETARFSVPNGGKWNDLPTSRICRGSDGIPRRMDRLESLGNAVVPQLIQMLGQRLIKFDKELIETSA